MMPRINGLKKRRETDFNLSEYFVVVALIAVCAILSVISPVFLSIDNIINVFLQTSINSIVAVGMTMVILTAGIDLSVGSLVAVTGMTAGLTFEIISGNVNDAGVALLCIILAMAIGALGGLVNGFLIAKTKLPPFIATLGMMSMARGLSLMISGGQPVTRMPSIIKFIGSGRIGVIYTPIIVMIAVYFVGWWMLRYTKLGRSTYAVGGNLEAARLSGINVSRTLMLVYMISGICTSIAAVVLMGRLDSAQPTAGKDYELDAIAATVIGGTSMSGGEGRLIGTLIGALFMAVLRNGLNLLDVSPYATQLVIGLVIILAVMMDRLRNRGRR
jgi:ribose/xylose/arabinose/galactoside ABC-type transport system permease subunit